MDLSDLVHGLKPKSERKSGTRTPQESGGRGSGSSSAHHGKASRDSRGRGQQATSGSIPSSPPREDPTALRVGSASGNTMALSCDLCKRTFESKKQFDQHSAVFHGRSKNVSKSRDAAYPCPFCGKAFTSPSKRTVHQNATHMGLRPFQCNLCEKSFGYRGDLTKHMTTHSGAKPHSCYICGAKFARNFYVKRHIETVHERKSSDKK